MQNTIIELNKKISKNSRKIDNLTNTIAETGNATLVSTLENLETERDDLNAQLIREENKVKSRTVDENVIKSAFTQAKKMFESGELEDTRQLINLYLENIIVYKEYVDIVVNVLPFFSDETDDITDVFRKVVAVTRKKIYSKF